MIDKRDDGLDKLEVLLSLQSLLDFAKISADEIAEHALVDAIEDAKDVVETSIAELRG